jgi:hypothetical protein
LRHTSVRFPAAPLKTSLRKCEHAAPSALRSAPLSAIDHSKHERPKVNALNEYLPVDRAAGVLSIAELNGDLGQVTGVATVLAGSIKGNAAVTDGVTHVAQQLSHRRCVANRLNEWRLVPVD